MDTPTPIRPLPAGPPARRLLPKGRTVIVALGVLVAVDLLIWAGHGGGQGQANPNGPLPHAIESLTPTPGSVIRPQEDVGADLQDTYTGALFIDEKRIPQDQTKIILGLGQVSFRPGPNKEFTVLAPGNHHATILYWPQEKGDEDAARHAGALKSYTWQFTAG